MITSAAGKYRDIVALYELNRFNSDILMRAFIEVMKRLDATGFKVFVVSTDNHSANRSFFTMLSGGKLEVQVRNPANGDPLFLMIDPTHNFKNIFNNFHIRRNFSFPAVPGTNATNADFK